MIILIVFFNGNTCMWSFNFDIGSSCYISSVAKFNCHCYFSAYDLLLRPDGQMFSTKLNDSNVSVYKVKYKLRKRFARWRSLCFTRPTMLKIYAEVTYRSSIFGASFSIMHQILQEKMLDLIKITNSTQLSAYF